MRSTNNFSQRGGRAAIFVDYENLYNLLNDRLDSRRYPDEIVSEILDELRRHLANENGTRTVVTVAYADFSTLDGDGHYIQRTLYLQGAEPRFVPGTLQVNAVEIQLCVDAMEVMHHRPDIDTFVLVTGNRAYMPMLQQFRRYGRHALLTALEMPSAIEQLQTGTSELILDAATLLSESSYRDVFGEPPAQRDAPRKQEAAPVRQEPITFRVIEDAVALRTLEIIDEHFGQYEEVYLTPLLRKLSELLDERQHDPKNLISTLESCGAVRLEKRRGYPYDYTVLIVEGDHPDVRTIVGNRSAELTEAWEEQRRREASAVEEILESTGEADRT